MEWSEITLQSQSAPNKSSGTICKENERQGGVINNITPHLTAQKYSESPVRVELQCVSSNWINGQLPPTLCNITTTINSGELCALVGAVGSGKSSVLHLLLKELNPGAGNMIFTQNLSQNSAKDKTNNGYITDNPNLRISYASQEAWLFVDTVRNNILFGQPYDRARYTQVLSEYSVRIYSSYYQ